MAWLGSAWLGLVASQLAVALEQPPPFFVCLAPRRALDLNSAALLTRAKRRIAVFRHYSLEVHAIGGLEQRDRVIKAL
jgi:hypothetical protein